MPRISLVLKLYDTNSQRWYSMFVTQMIDIPSCIHPRFCLYYISHLSSNNALMHSQVTCNNSDNCIKRPWEEPCLIIRYALFLIPMALDIICYKKHPVQFWINWSRVTHICVSKLTIIGLDNGLSPGRCQAIIWTKCWNIINWSLRNKRQPSFD